MRLAYILFEGITWLDFIGVYDPVSRLKSLNYLPRLTWDLCAVTERVSDHFGLEVRATKVKPSLANYEAIIVPGGYGTRALQSDTDFVSWLQTAQAVPQKISICTGSLLLGAAGFLEGKKATTHHREFDALQQYSEVITNERIVVDGNVITAGGVSSSLDLGLYLCQLWAGDEAAADIRKRMEYRG